MDHPMAASPSHMQWQYAASLHGANDFLKRVLREVLSSLDHVDLAIADGNALDQLQEKLRGAHLDAAVRLEGTPGMQDERKRDMAVCVVTTEPLPPEVHFHIHQILAEVCRRVRMNIRAGFVVRQDRAPFDDGTS